MTKYCIDPTVSILIDNKTVLEEEDDVANQTLGGNWRMPTYFECIELMCYCTWEGVTVNGGNGCKITSQKTGNSIFIL